MKKSLSFHFTDTKRGSRGGVTDRWNCKGRELVELLGERTGGTARGENWWNC